MDDGRTPQLTPISTKPPAEEPVVHPQVQKTRSKKRHNVIARSKHREDFEKLMKANWSSAAIERYALWRYGEDIPEITIRKYRLRKKINAAGEKRYTLTRERSLDEMVVESLDVLGQRAQLIALQVKRIDDQQKQEVSGRHADASLRQEVLALNTLLDSEKADMQDLGMFPKQGDEITIRSGREDKMEETVPRYQTLGDALGFDKIDADGDEAEAAKIIHMALKKKTG